MMVGTKGEIIMTTWNDMKHNLNSINPDEMTAIESLAYLHASG